jgi:hypothetical protein
MYNDPKANTWLGWDGRPFDYPPYPPQEYGYEYEYNYPPRPPRSGSGLGGLLGEVVDGIGELVGGIGEALQGV